MRNILDLSKMAYKPGDSSFAFFRLSEQKQNETTIFAPLSSYFTCREEYVKNLIPLYKGGVLPEKIYMCIWYRTALNLSAINFLCARKGWELAKIIAINEIIIPSHLSVYNHIINAQSYVLEVDSRWYWSSILTSFLIFHIRICTYYFNREINNEDEYKEYANEVEKCLKSKGIHEVALEHSSWISQSILLIDNIEYILFGENKPNSSLLFEYDISGFHRCTPDEEKVYIGQRGGSDTLFRYNSIYRKVQERFRKIALEK